MGYQPFDKNEKTRAVMSLSQPRLSGGRAYLQLIHQLPQMRSYKRCHMLSGSNAARPLRSASVSACLLVPFSFDDRIEVE